MCFKKYTTLLDEVVDRLGKVNYLGPKPGWIWVHCFLFLDWSWQTECARSGGINVASTWKVPRMHVSHLELLDSSCDGRSTSMAGCCLVQSSCDHLEGPDWWCRSGLLSTLKDQVSGFTHQNSLMSTVDAAQPKAKWSFLFLVNQGILCVTLTQRVENLILI